MTDFFERQNIARRKTQILLFYFIPAVTLTIGGIYLFFVILLNYFSGVRWEHMAQGQHYHPQLALAVCEVTLIIIICGSLAKIWNLQQGGGAIATMLGARPVPLQPQDPDERKFRDVVEEMSIASGVSVPQLFVLPRENGINAFAAGHAANDAAIVVTRGALKLLTRDELQGVIAHEFSHICNGDMSLNLWLIGVVHGILCIALLGKFLVRTAMDGDMGRAGGPPLVVGCILFVGGSIGYFFGSLIKCAVSRQREYLADAAAVQFTRNPLGLAAALKKIGGLREGSDILAPNAAEISHLFFADANTSWLFSTHPPLAERIKLLDPSFRGIYPTVTPMPDDTPVVHPSLQFMPMRAKPAQSVQNTIKRPIPGPQHLAYAAGLTASFPPEIQSAAHEPFGACALVYAMLLDCDSNVRSKQFIDTTEITERPLLNSAQQFFTTFSTLTSGQKLGLVNLAMPALRQMSARQFETFSQTVQQLSESDSKISLFEYALQKILLRHLEPRFKQTKPAIAQYYAAAGLAGECAVLFSALAYESSDASSEITAAFQAGADSLDLPPQKQIALLAREQCNLSQIDTSVQKITQAALPVKKQILNACALVVASDSLVKEEEAEMLRAIADAIGCPLPPFVSLIGIPEAA